MTLVPTTRGVRCGLGAHWPAVLVLTLCAVLDGFRPTWAAKWDPIPATDLAAAESASFPGADAEILLSEHFVESDLRGDSRMVKLSGTDSMREGQFFVMTDSVTRSHVLAKVYTAKGVQEQGRFVIERTGRIRDAEARVVKPDGTSIELTKKDIFENEEVEEGDKKLSFVFPGLEPGDIVEYRWLTQHLGVRSFRTYTCQQRLPVREYRFNVGTMFTECFVSWLNCPNVEQVREGGKNRVVIRNLPAFEREPYMPATSEYSGWLFMLPSKPLREPKELWPEYSTLWAREFEVATKPSRAMAAKATELAVGTGSDDEKIQRLYEFCQSEIANFAWVDSPELQKNREKNREIVRAAMGQTQAPVVRSVFEERAGDPETINLVFAAMARSLGFSVRQTRSAPRTALTKIRTNMGWAFLTRRLVAVELDGKWRHFDPGSYFVPFGMLGTNDENVVAMRCENAATVPFEPTASSPAELTQVQRKARFNLDAEGTLEGDVEEHYTGHLAVARKERSWRRSDEDADKAFRGEVAKRLPNAEVSAVVFTNLRTRELPLIIKYHVRVPGFAGQAGRRLVLAPSFFKAGESVVFTEDERKYPISFPFAWSEHDEVEIVIPEGYVLDQPSAPAPVGDSSRLGSAYRLEYGPKARTLSYRRDFTVGGNGVLAFKVESYPLLKRLFEQVHASDAHALLFKPKDEPVADAADGALPAPTEGVVSAAAQP